MNLRILLLAALLIPSPAAAQDVLSLCEWTGFECEKRKPKAGTAKPKPKPPAPVQPEVKGQVGPSNWDVGR